MRHVLVGLICLLIGLFSTCVSAKIIFYGYADEGSFIYIMDDNGSNITQLTQVKYWGGFPRWSPEGKQIVFVSRSSLHLMDVDGSNSRQLTQGEPRVDGAWHGQPIFSPTGQSVAFRWNEKADNGDLIDYVSIINIATGKIRNIAKLSYDAGDPLVAEMDWSPDGKQIVFSTPLGLGGEWRGNLWVMDADGGNLRVLTEKLQNQNEELQIVQLRPRWSPDGKKVLYFQNEFKWEPEVNNPNNFLRNEKAHRHIICDRNGKTLQELRIPKKFFSTSLDWMDGDKSVLLCGFYEKLGLQQPGAPHIPSKIYKYTIWTGEVKQLTDSSRGEWMVDWIDDDVLSVSPKGKKKVTWGVLKQ